MWLIAFLWAVLIVNFALDLVERKQKGESIGWPSIRGNFFAVVAFGVVVGGGYGFLQMFPDIGKRPFPHWLGLALAGTLLLFLWFASTFAIASDNKRFVESPLQIVNESVGEEQIGFLGLLAILLAGIAFLRFNFPAWAGFLLLLPCWILLFYVWAASNWLLAWALLHHKISKRRRRKSKPHKL